MPVDRGYATAARIGALVALWVALSGKLDAVHLGFGAVSVALTAWMTRDLHVADTLSARGRSLGRVHFAPALRYPFWLLKEIAIANVQIARLILDPRLPVDPVVVRFDSRLESVFAQALLANSITLTPGTFTIDIGNGIFTVHALDAAGASATALGGMRGRVAAVFGEREVPAVLLLDVRRGAEVGPA